MISLISFDTLAQSFENNFEKVKIEIDGEAVYDVNHISQDFQGYMWMDTNLGLIRYDGFKGKKYNISKSDSTTVSNDYVRALFVDSQNILWIGANSGVGIYKPECDCIENYPSTIGNNSMTMIRSITEDKNNNIWIGTKNGSLFRYDRSRNEFSRILPESYDSKLNIKDRIGNLLVDQSNNLWIGTNSGLIRYNIATEKTEWFLHNTSDSNSLIDNKIRALYEDKQGQILIGTFKSGLHIYDPKNDNLKRIISQENNPNILHAPYSEESVFGEEPHVNLIHQDKLGDYWIGTTGKGVNNYNIRTKTNNFFSFNLVNPQVFWSIYEDRQGNIWLGAGMGGGLFKTDIYAGEFQVNQNFTNVERAYESELNPGILWVISQETSLSKLNLETNEITNYLHDEDDDKSIGHKWVRTLYQENKNTLWIGLGNGGAYGFQDGNGGLDRMNIKSGEFTNFRLTRDDDGRGDFSYTVYAIAEDKEGYLWLGTGPGGIFRSDKDKKEFIPFKVENDTNTSKDVYLNIVRIDSNGNVWASDFANEGTLYLYDREEEKFIPFLKGFKMYNLLVDENDWLLISTWEKGIIHLNPIDKSYIQYTKKDGLPSLDAVDITKGENSIVWVSTRIGPAKFDTKTGNISTVGLPKQRYNSGIFKASNGLLYVGSNNGLYSFYPNQFLKNPYAPKLTISELLVSDKDYLSGRNQTEPLEFSYNQNDIEINYLGLHYSDATNNSYQYKLTPINEDWVNVGNERTARFFNLSPDTYNFHLKASNSDGVWSNEYNMLQFTIHPPWWSSWWAYAIYFILIGFLTNRIYRFQLSKKLAASESKRLREVNEFKNNLFTNITHEFRTPLTVIKGMTDSIKSNFKSSKTDDIENSLEMIKRNSESLLHLVNEMLDLSKIESGNMELQLVQSDVIPFLKYLSESFSSFAEENKINLTIYSEIDSLLMDFDGYKLTSVISNLLSNAIKFTPEYGKIIVHIKQVEIKDESHLFIKIKDNGVGIPKDELPNIFTRFYQTDASTIRKHEGTGIGLALTKELVELMNGTIEAKSKLDKGSEFSLNIPITRNAPSIAKVQVDDIPTTPKVNVSSKKIEQTLKSDSKLPLVLIVEDNMDVAHYLKTCLKNKYDTIHAINGIEGIEMALDKIPDIIISDVMMPGKDGFEVCETLKSDERTDHIPIIILTAKAGVEDRIQGLSHGADAYLAKPFNKEELFTRLDQLVSLRKKLINKIQNDGFKTILKRQSADPKLQFIQKAVKLIQEDISNSNFGSEDLAKRLLISKSQLYRKIKAITEKSTAVFIRSIRLQYAKELLSTTEKTVSEVAYEVGFKDPSWFSRAFKDEFGLSPSEVSK
ncbi:MAG: response regulator [Flavobacteriaceae bacterium]|nr:response regulator [Flavobacteriaceae bacterium]